MFGLVLLANGCGGDNVAGDLPINECDLENGGCEQLCTDLDDGFVCDCEDGYESATDGAACINIDDCADSLCLNDGTCVDGVASYICECADGFEAADCGSNIDDCADSNCLNGATCVDGITSFTCECALGFEGAYCGVDTDDCASSPCLNDGTCADGVASYICECADGFAGDDCGTNIDDCADAPCLNGGSCVDGVASYTCDCFYGFGGEDCAECTGLVMLKTGPVKTIPTAGVRMVFSVETCDGLPVPDLLEQGAIEILNDETGKPFGSEGDAAPSVGEAKDFAFYTLVVLDLSYSVVNNGSLESELDGAISLVQQLVEQPADARQKHNVALYAFGSTSQSELLQDFTKDHDLLYQQLDALKSDPGKGSTNLYGAYMTGLGVVETQGLGEEKVLRSMVLMTDGTHETGDADELEAEALSALDQTTVDVYTIGLLGDYDEAKLQILASAPENFLLAEEASALVEAFGVIAAAVDAWAKSNYVIGVCSPVEGPDRSLTLNATYGLKSGSLSAEYDATGFDLTGCDPVYVSDPCGSVECGVMEGIVCSSCQGGLVCIENACEDKLCVPGIVYCEGQVVTQCDAQGASNAVLEACDASSHFCEEGEQDAWCSPHVCTPDSAMCDGDTRYICDAMGSGPLADSETDCSEQGKVCFNGACADLVCVPDALFCDGQTLTQCDGSGASFTPVETCNPNAQFCEQAADTAWCAPHVCTPDAPACDGSTGYICNADGSGVLANSEADCAADGKVCVEGACVEMLCLPNTTYCEGNILETCAVDGMSVTSQVPCGATQYCQQGDVMSWCVDWGCIPNQALCDDGNTAYQCDAIGSGPLPDSAIDCGTGLCVEGTCLEVVCGDGVKLGDEQCDDSNSEDGDGCSSDCKVDLGTEQNPAGSCQAILEAGHSTGDGAYWLTFPDLGAKEVICDMTTAGGGWMSVLPHPDFGGVSFDACAFWSLAGDSYASEITSCGEDGILSDCTSDTCEIRLQLALPFEVHELNYTGEVHSSGGSSLAIWAAPSMSEPNPGPPHEDFYSGFTSGSCALNGEISEQVSFQSGQTKLGWYSWSDTQNLCPPDGAFWHLETVWVR
jgi:hypothetical protein